MRAKHKFLIVLTIFVGLAVGLGCSASLDKHQDAVQKQNEHYASTPLSTSVQNQIISIGQNDNQVMEHLDHLANNIGSRLEGSSNIQTAYKWARSQFNSFGLDNVHLEKCGEIPVGFDRGRSKGRITIPINKKLHFSTPAWTAGTQGNTSAPVVLAPESASSLEKKHHTLKGAWALWRPSKNMERNHAYIEKWNELNVDAKGIIAPTAGEYIITVGNHQIDIFDLPKVPSIILLKEEWDEIADIIKEGEEPILEFDIHHRFRKGPVSVYNVVADIPGVEKPDEYVIVGAHIDSRDGATGALDNGTGVAATMEAARILMEAGVKPRRTIRFILFGGEEIGLIGSNAYIDNHPELVPKISAMFNMDRGGDYITGIQATEAMLEDFEIVFAPVKSLNPDVPFTITQVEHLPRVAKDCCLNQKPASPFEANSCGELIGCASGGSESCGSSELTSCGESSGSPKRVRKVMFAGSSDHAPFVAAGVPAFYWDQNSEDPLPYPAHTQFDTYDKADAKRLKHSVTVIALTSLGVANLNHMLPRDEPAVVSETILEQYAGEYRVNPNMLLKVTANTDHLIVEATGETAGVLYPQTETRFFSRTDDTEFEFFPDKKGEIPCVLVCKDGYKFHARNLEFPKPEPPAERQVVEIDPAILDTYVGEYALSARENLTVTRENDMLFVQLTGQFKINVYPESETDFFYKVVDAQIRFVKTKDGSVTHLVLHQNGTELQADRQ